MEHGGRDEESSPLSFLTPSSFFTTPTEDYTYSPLSPPSQSIDVTQHPPPPDYEDQEMHMNIHAYLRSIEDKRKPNPNYIETLQREVMTTHVRRITVDWLVKVAEMEELLSDTVFLAVSYLGRYLSSKAVSPGTFLVLLGSSCMNIASKYEERFPIAIEYFCNEYTKQEVIDMELDVLKTLDFELGDPTIKTFLRMFTRTLGWDSQLEFLARYLAELCLLEYDFIRFLPSLVAASVIFLAKFTVHPEIKPWSLSDEKISGYKACDLKECVLNIHNLQKRGDGGGVLDKYKLQKFECVALIASPPDISTEYFDEVYNRLLPITLIRKYRFIQKLMTKESYRKCISVVLKTFDSKASK